MRSPQSKGLKGSQKWIQILINESPHLLDEQIHSVLKIKAESISIKWVSPLKKDDFAEYRDDDFLKILGLHHHNDSLKDFWPKGGPQWDGLGKSNDKIFLVEAKANIPELISSSQAKSKTSIIQIENSLRKTQDYLNCKPIIDWIRILPIC